MTHLKIEQNNGITEQVSPSVIRKLYEIVHSGNLDSSSNLMGSLNTTSTYQNYVDYLEEQFTKNGIRQLVITANKLYISFADPEVQRVLTSKYGDGIGIQRSDLEGVSMLPHGCFDGNTTIETFDELGQFPSVVSLNYDTFRNCSNLKSVDLSNITTFQGGNIFAGCTNLGSTNNGILNLPKLNSLSNGNSIFTSCSSLIEVNIGSQLSNAERTTVIPGSFFNDCTNLEKVTGLNMIQHLKGSAFYNCFKLKSIDIISNLTTLDAECFFECRSLQCIDLSNVTTLNNNGHFRGCTSLVDLATSDPTQINTGAATYTFNWSTIPNQVFVNCKLTNKSFSFPNATSIGSSSFYGSGIVGITFPNVTTIGNSAFYGCNKLTSIDLSNITSIGENVFKDCTSLGYGQTLELNLTNQNTYPYSSLANTKYTRLILHSPQQQGRYDDRYPVYENMDQLQYLDLSDWRPAPSSFNSANHGDHSFYNNNSLVTYIAPVDTTYIDTIIKNLNYSRYLILLSTTPPRLNTTDHNNPPAYWFDYGNVHIYVPDSAKAAYLADTDWASIGGVNGSDTIVDRLHGLSELPAGVWTTGLASQYLTPAQLTTS